MSFGLNEFGPEHCNNRASSLGQARAGSSPFGRALVGALPTLCRLDHCLCHHRWRRAARQVFKLAALMDDAEAPLPGTRSLPARTTCTRVPDAPVHWASATPIVTGFAGATNVSCAMRLSWEAPVLWLVQTRIGAPGRIPARADALLATEPVEGLKNGLSRKRVVSLPQAARPPAISTTKENHPQTRERHDPMRAGMASLTRTAGEKSTPWGGPHDVIARPLAQALTTSLGQFGDRREPGGRCRRHAGNARGGACRPRWLHAAVR